MIAKKIIGTIVIGALTTLMLGACAGTAGSDTKNTDVNDAVTVNTSLGAIEGIRGEDGIVYFKGIPYSENTGRWEEAREVTRYAETVKAHEYGPAAIQPVSEEETSSLGDQSEDCLTLSITKSEKDESAKKPVMVWIHGGSYTWGGSNEPMYDATNMVQNNPDVIYVSVQYRLGILGSMNLSSLDTEGKYKNSVNLNILDQITALKWIHNNIDAFGGDPENVTIYGQSAGGYSVSTLMTNAEATQYFQKAIAESTVFDRLSMKTVEQSKEIGDAFIEMTGAKSMDDLLNLTAEQIQEYTTKLSEEYDMTYAPVQDGITVPLDAYKALEEGSAKNIKLIVGSTAGEFDNSYVEMSEEELKENTVGCYPGVTESVVDKIASSNPNRDKKTAYMDIINDMNIRMPGLMIADAQSRHNDTYLYYVSYTPDGAAYRAPHCTEIPMVMGQPDTLPYLYGLEDADIPYDTTAQVMAAWVNFARTGNPNGEGVSVTWDKYDSENRTTMVVDNEITVSGDVRPDDTDVLLPLFNK